MERVWSGYGAGMAGLMKVQRCLWVVRQRYDGLINDARGVVVEPDPEPARTAEVCCQKPTKR
jgi:hypothetical protein